LFPPVAKNDWTNDTCVSELLDEIFQQLQKHQQTIQDVGELEKVSPTYEKPEVIIKSIPGISQRSCFNLIQHQGTVCNIPTIKLFKSFAATL
jgi:ERCC4-type nuclease